MNVVVCIPAFNEEKNIAKVILGVEKYADKIIVCDDGSSDMTYKIAKKLGVEVIKHNSNLGKGAAIRSLVKQSLTSIFDILIICVLSWLINLESLLGFNIFNNLNLISQSFWNDEFNFVTFRALGNNKE